MPNTHDEAPTRGFKPGKRFGELIREYRDDRARWDQQTLARFAGIANRATISKIERGGGCDPETARGIIAALDRQLDLRWRELRELAVEYLLTDALQTAKTDRKIIGLIVPGIVRSLYWGPVVGAIEAAATPHKYLVVLCQHHNDIDRMLDGLSFFENFDSLRGVIVSPAFGIEEHSRADLEALNRVVDRLARRAIPTVFLDRRVNIKTPVPYIGLNNRYAACLAVRRLIKEGHVRIGALFDLQYASPQQERMRGYQDALAEAGIPFVPALVKHGDEVHAQARQGYYERYGRRRGLENARELLALRPRPTAIFCATGDLALRARRGRRSNRDAAVPQDPGRSLDHRL